MEKSTKMKLLVCYHKPSNLLKDEILTPIHVGRALARERMDPESESYQWLMQHLIGDDTGENISRKNGSYNEMTALYWAWKNYQELGNPDYIGLMHYRRHFILQEGEIDVVPFDEMGEHYFDEIHYSVENMQKLVRGCDFIAHIGKVKHVYRHYLENHRKEDLDLAFEILYEKYPAYREVAEEYLNGDYSNFCNMFIFSREIFFEYCAWIFSILEEFERRVDIREKRLFISERLSGVFIAKRMKEKKLKYKVVPISFIAESMEIPIVLPLDERKEFELVVSVTSLLVNKKANSRYAIFFLAPSVIENEIEEKVTELVRKYPGCRIQILHSEIQREYYPLLLSELLPEVKKCIYMEENVLILKDLGEFFRTCSVDDYDVIGAPLFRYDSLEEQKKVNLAFLVMNCGAFRKKKIFQRMVEPILAEEAGGNLFHDVLKGQIGYIPWYYLTVESQVIKQIFGETKSRVAYQEEALWKPALLYDAAAPWENLQGVFSIFWWDIAEKVTVEYAKLSIEEEKIRELFIRQQKTIHEVISKKEMDTGIEKKKSEDWRTYSFFGKLKFYYTHNGWKRTIRYGMDKLRGKV